MPAPKLRHDVATSTTATNVDVVAPVPANRAAVGKLLLINRGPSATCSVYIGGGAGAFAATLIGQITIVPGQTYTEPQLVIKAGERLLINATSNDFTAAFFGEEVDN